MKLIDVAKDLDGIEYPCRIDKNLAQQAKDAGIVIVFGASDDLIEFRGAIHDEVGVSEVDVTIIDGKGVLPVDINGNITDPDAVETIQGCKNLAERFTKSVAVTSYWCPADNSGASWAYSVPEHIEWEPFNVMEDGELYCVGVVFKLPK
jgi:hypothetical protein